MPPKSTYDVTGHALLTPTLTAGELDEYSLLAETLLCLTPGTNVTTSPDLDIIKVAIVKTINVLYAKAQNPSGGAPGTVKREKSFNQEVEYFEAGAASITDVPADALRMVDKVLLRGDFAPGWPKTASEGIPTWRGPVAP